ncbi:ATPase components of ABC transporters with duplicated ATPase domains [Arthrobacter woluwensis]|uniref:ATPase components of ABC transporters with duplicated ATPase domains n=1 Tax=Arthrobacter woluwensis TaxID=156980 RepID=A0A1H4PH83_9MICC|nr:ATPase components of ABC transporters with duplicated ATPase domains [Arthrobacter woluwensis]
MRPLSHSWCVVSAADTESATPTHPSEGTLVISVQDLELRAGARLLMDQVTFRIDKGDKIGLVGRNGAGKTTLTRVLAGEGVPAGGTVTRAGEIGYLPQDPRTPDMEQLARDRILSARGLDVITRKLKKAQEEMASEDEAVHRKAMNRYDRLEAEFLAGGGYAAESEAATISANLALPERILNQPLKTLSGGQRRRVELARILFSGADTMLLDEPTNHLDADSIAWLRDFLKSHQGGLIVISHDVDLLEATVNKVYHLDANRSTIDYYNMGWKRYLQQRETDERARRRERANAEKKASVLLDQANKMRAKASKATAAQNMIKRAERMLGGLEDVRAADRVAALRFPEPAPCGKTPLTAEGLSKSYGSLEIFTDVDLAIDRGSRVVVLGLNGAGKTTLLRMLAGVDAPDTGEVIAGHGLKIGYYAQEHETLDHDRTVLENMRSAAPQHMTDTEVRSILGSFLFVGDDVDKPAGVLSGGEKTRLALATIVASSANVLLLDEPTNNLDPASRAEILGALANYQGAVVLVSHDEGAVEALNPERVVLLPDGVEDLWNADYLDLITLA